MEGPTPLQSSLLAGLPGVRHGFFTRQGGVSRGLYASLNVGLGSGDDVDDVIENRRRAAAAFDAKAEALTTCYQIHSANVTVAEGLSVDGARPKADGVVTANAGVLCGALAADCAPVLIADPQARVVAAVHAGWRGALGGVIEAAVETMVGLGASPRRMSAAIGPCIGPESYEVGGDFLTAFQAGAEDVSPFFSPGATSDKWRFDLPAYCLTRLAAAGVGGAEWIGCDTCADEQSFFSNRRAFKRGEADYGRLLSVIVLDR